VRIERRKNRIWCELTAPEQLSLGPPIASEVIAQAASIEPSQITTAAHPPRVASVGLPFIMVELKDRAALSRARINMAGFDTLVKENIPPHVHLYVRTGGTGDDFDVRTRMFAPLDGVPEDAATGSANVALAALLAHLDRQPSATFRYRISQGVEIGRPSVLEARVEKRDGKITSAHIGGECVLVSEGWIETG
jgi:trans-2,3-dihydro-3-hydroxyanthranilate isomerase